jgi:hypothetical protein
MTMTPEQQRAIIARESAWIDADNFAPLDLSAFPALNELPLEHRDDGRFAKDWRDTALSASAAALRKFVEDPDVSALERIGEETGNPGYLREVRARKGETVAGAFKRKCPTYLPTEQNYERNVQTLAFNALSTVQQEGTIEEMTDDLIAGGFWIVPNLEACYLALSGEGQLQIPAGQARNLSDRERLHVTRLAQVGRTEDAVSQYLKYALDEEEEPSMEILHEPVYRQCCDDAVFTVFEANQSDYAPTPERERYLLRYAGSRPLTLTLLQQGWISCQANEKRHERGELLNSYQRPEDSPPRSPKEIDALDDASVDRLYHQSLRAYADQFRRRAPGVGREPSGWHVPFRPAPGGLVLS